MDIVTYQPEHLSELTALYNALIQPVPFCYPISEEELAAAFAGDCGYESFGERLVRETVFVAIDRGVAGFVHVGEGRTARGDVSQAQGVIRFLAYPRGRRDVGQALLAEAEDWCRTAGLETILIYRQAYRYPFYHFSHAYLSNRLEHIQALLLFNDYEVCGGEIYLDWPDMTPAAPAELLDLGIDLVVQPQSGQGHLPDLVVKAFLDGHEIGECVSLSAATFLAREELNDRIFTQWLGVTDAYQGKGVGRYLLGSALVEAHKIGYRHAAISTALNNHRALLFYANFGYKAVDWTRQFEKRRLPTERF